MSKINDVDSILTEGGFIDELPYVFGQVENALIDRPNSTVINFGPGPCQIAGFFVEKLAAKCGKIILVEISEIFCAEYVQSEWYNKHREKITILNVGMESAMESGKFDGEDISVLFLSNVLYFVQMKRMRQVFNWIAQCIAQNHATGIIVMAHKTCAHKCVFRDFYNYRHLEAVDDEVERLRATHEIVTQATVMLEAVTLEDIQTYVLGNVVEHPDYMDQATGSPQALEVSWREAKRVFNAMLDRRNLTITYVVKDKVE